MTAENSARWPELAALTETVFLVDVIEDLRFILGLSTHAQ